MTGRSILGELLCELIGRNGKMSEQRLRVPLSLLQGGNEIFTGSSRVSSGEVHCIALYS